MRILAADHGSARIGLAISDPTGVVARPLEVIRHKARKLDAQRIAAIASQHGAKLILVGLPTNADGRDGPAARTVRRFGETLRTVSKLPVLYWDESFSTQRAEHLIRAMRRSSRPAVDAAAAAVILQDYLDARAAQID